MTNHATASVDQGGIIRGLTSKVRVSIGSSTYNQILECLYDEAAALDERRFADWVAMLGKDLKYTAPLRLTRTGVDRDCDVVRTTKHFDEDYASILRRVGRLSGSAWSEDPPSRTRRCITNVRMAETDEPGVFEVVSYITLERSRGDSWINERMTAERRDIWRNCDGEYLLARREIIVDQSTLSMSNFAVFF